MSGEATPRACWTCAHWTNDRPVVATGIRNPAGSNQDLGICEAYPPVVVTVGPERSVISAFPATHCDRVCGMWEPVFDGSDPDDPAREPAPVIDLAERRQAA